MKDLSGHHRVWLMAHPDRDELWLRRVLRDGFDVHHMDGNCDNNHPNNLVLIERADHMRLHGSETFLRPLSRRSKANDAAGEQAYTLRLAGHGWSQIGDTVFAGLPAGLAGKAHTAMARAKAWAHRNGKDWPVPIPVE